MPVSIHNGQILKKKSTEFIHTTERSERLIERVRKESEASKYGELCARIQKQIDETRMRISSVKMQLHIADHALDQALLQWKYEYLMKQEQWLVELMCGKIEEEKQEEKQ